MRDIYCKQLLKAVKLAQSNGLKVYVAESKLYIAIQQVYIVEGNDICMCTVHWGDVRFSTVHKPTGHSGLGFGLGVRKKNEPITIEEIRRGFVRYPKWVKGCNTHPVEKYKNWSDFVKAQVSSDYYELEIL